jgi:hypothetical protein
MGGGDTSTNDRGLHAQVQADGFTFAPAAQMRPLLERCGALSDWATFAASWDDLVLDRYLVDQGRFRRRRHAVFMADADGSIRREAHRPHYQSRDYNRVYGGIERWFEPIEAAIADGATLQAVLRFCVDFFSALAGVPTPWDIEVHQFRIEARPDEPGQPTPEGVHRDGVDYVLVLLVARNNIASGTTTIHAADGTQLGSFTLTQPCDAALVDDTRVFHGVTAVQPIDPAQAACRDVLVVTLRRAAVENVPVER